MYGSSYFAIQATEKYSAAIYYSYNEQSFDSMTWKILQLSTCFCISGSGGRDRGSGEGGLGGGSPSCGCACGRGKGCVDVRVN